MDVGDVIDLDVTGVAHGGVFVARVPADDGRGRVVFVPDTLPGERVRVRLTDTRKKSFWRAETLEVLDASPHRVPHLWGAADISRPPAERAGGADLGHIALEHQRVLKTRVVLDAFARIGKLDDAAVVMNGPTAIIDDDGTTVAEERSDGAGWRTRMSLHVDDEGRVGPYAARSHRVIPVDDLPLATEAVERASVRLHGGRPGRIDLVQPADGRVRVVNRPDDDRASGAAEVIEEVVRGRTFRVDAGGFWQVHRLAAHTLTGVVAGMLRGDRTGGPAIDPDAAHLDLYGGVGLFAATLAELGGRTTRVTSVESDERATEHAGENLSEWIGARAETARVDRFVRRVRAEASASERERLSRGVVLLDPPRAGAGRDAVEGIAELGPESVVYVACDPVALARDLATFATRGYRLDGAVQAFDLFPHSHHVEAVALLRR